MPIGQPLIILVAALFGGLVTLFTAPLWMRVVKSFAKLIKHQVIEAAQVLEEDKDKESK
jgi:hypothetical protein